MNPTNTLLLYKLKIIRESRLLFIMQIIIHYADYASMQLYKYTIFDYINLQMIQV